MELTLAYFQKASRLFDGAWARPIEERAVFLAAACCDDLRLRSEVATPKHKTANAKTCVSRIMIDLLLGMRKSKPNHLTARASA